VCYHYDRLAVSSAFEEGSLDTCHIEVSIKLYRTFNATSELLTETIEIGLNRVRDSFAGIPFAAAADENYALTSWIVGIKRIFSYIRI